MCQSTAWRVREKTSLGMNSLSTWCESISPAGAREDPEREVSRLKNDTGGPIAIFGSARLASAILSKGLLDEVRVMVNPVILGRGIPCFRTTPATGCIS